MAYISWFIYYSISVLIITQPRKLSSSCNGKIQLLFYYSIIILDSYSKQLNAFDEISIPPLCDIPIDSMNKVFNLDDNKIH